MKNILFITMLLGVGYSWECEEYNETYGANYNCACNEDTWQEYYPNMAGCWLQGAYLGGANLSWANLGWANLTWANLTWANLGWANLTGADFTDASCYGAFFVGATLEGTIFDGAYLQYAYFDDNSDGYDDVSYDAGYDIGAQSGDVNLDGELNILDLVTSANNILEN